MPKCICCGTLLDGPFEICNACSKDIQAKDATIASLREEVEKEQRKDGRTVNEFLQAIEGREKENEALRAENERLKAQLEATGEYLKNAKEGWRNEQKRAEQAEKELAECKFNLNAIKDEVDDPDNDNYFKVKNIRRIVAG